MREEKITLLNCAPSTFYPLIEGAGEDRRLEDVGERGVGAADGFGDQRAAGFDEVVEGLELGLRGGVGGGAGQVGDGEILDAEG